MKFRKKQVVIEAFQWWKHGDVPEVVMIPLKYEQSEARRRKLGWIDTPQGGHIVWPGEWVIIDQKGNLSTCNPTTFARLYESLETKILPLQRTQGKAS